MRIIVLLVCLALNHFAEIKATFRPYHWFDRYVSFFVDMGATQTWLRAWPALLLIMLPLLLLIGLLASLFCHVLGSSFYFVFSALILLYCLGPEDLLWQAKRYQASVANESSEQAMLYQQLVGEALPDEPQQAAGKLTDKVLMLANPRLFAVLFWFLALGPMGAVLYRFTYLLAKQAPASLSVDGIAQSVTAYLDWIPVRLLTMTYGLVGDFIGSFGRWAEYAAQGPDKNDKLLRECGLAACAAEDKLHCGDGDLVPAAAIDLLKRSTVVCFVLVAMLGLAAWVI